MRKKTEASIDFFSIQNDQLIGLMLHLERYTDTQQVSGFNSGRYDLNSIKSCLILHLIYEKEIEPSAVKTANYLCKSIVRINASQFDPHSM